MFHFPVKKKQTQPVSLFDALHHDLDQFFDLSWPSVFNRGTSLLEGAWFPALDVIDEKDHLKIRVELPGLSKKDVNVAVEDRYLTITGEKKSEEDNEDKQYVRSERYYGRFQRTITLPNTVDVNQAKATFKEGVLTLQLPKKEEHKSRQINIDIE